MKKKKILIPIIIIGVIAVFIFGYLFFTSLKVTNDTITLTNYTSIPITDKEVDLINAKNTSVSDICEMWSLKKLPDSNYGNLFRVVYKVDLKRHNFFNDYYASAQVDFSNLSDNEKVFFEKVKDDTSMYLFEHNESDDKSVASVYVGLSGATYGKSVEELDDIIRKVKIKIILQNKNGKIIEKSVSITDDEIIQEKEDKGDIINQREFLEEKVDDGLPLAE